MWLITPGCGFPAGPNKLGMSSLSSSKGIQCCTTRVQQGLLQARVVSEDCWRTSGPGARCSRSKQGRAPDLARGGQAAGEPRMGSCETYDAILMRRPRLGDAAYSGPAHAAHAAPARACWRLMEPGRERRPFRHAREWACAVLLGQLLARVAGNGNAASSQQPSLDRRIYRGFNIADQRPAHGSGKNRWCQRG